MTRPRGQGGLRHVSDIVTDITTPDTIDEVLADCVGLIDLFIEMFGPCDHEANVCVCDEIHVAERARRVLLRG